MEQDMITLDLRTIWGLIRKNIVLILILTIAGGGGTFYVSSYLIEPQYEAAVTLVVNTRDEQATVITNDQITSARQLVNTYAVILTNDTLLEELISELRLDDTITTLRKRISSEAVNQTQVLRMTMRDHDPDTAKAVLDAVMARAEGLLMTTVKAGSVEIVSPPRINYEPVSPRVMWNSVIGALCGLFVSMVIVFLKRTLTNTFISDEDITTHLELPILGVIPSLNNIQEYKYE